MIERLTPGPEGKILAGVLTFLRGVVLGADTPARSVELRQLIHGQPNRALLRWKIPEHQELEALGREVLELAQQDADAFGTPQTYVLVAYFQAEVWEATSAAFRLRSSVPGTSIEMGIGPGDVLETEPATPAGQAAQAMRHSEGFARIMVGSFAQLLGAYQIELKQLRDQKAATDQRWLDTQRLFEEASSGAHNRKLQIMREDRIERLTTKAFEHFQALVPTMLNQWMRSRGQVPMFDELPPEIDALDKIFGSLDKDQVRKIAATLSLPQRVAFAELYMHFAEREKQQQQKEQDGNGTPEPKPDEQPS